MGRRVYRNYYKGHMDKTKGEGGGGGEVGKKSLWSLRKKCEHKEQKQLLKAITSNVSALRASFLVAHRIAKAKKPFTVGEEWTLCAAKDICQGLLGEAAVQKVAPVPLSASTELD